MAMNHKIAMHFAARDAEALERLQRRQESPLAAATAKFTSDFGDAKQDIQEKLDKASGVSEANIANYFDQLLRQCQELQKLVSSAAGYLSAFDLRQSQKDVSDIQASVHARQSQMMPRKRFAFKTRSKPSASIESNTSCSTTATQPQLVIDDVDAAPRPHPIAENSSGGAISQHTSCGYFDLENETLMLKHEEVAQHDVALSRLRGCVVRLHGASSTLRLVSLENCTVLCGPVSTSVFLEKCKNCALVFACQQMRMHESTGCDVYLHVTSRAIIEDCSGIRFAPYNYLYDELSDHFELSGLNREWNNWQAVDDFKWLSSTPSPNWCVLPEGERSVSWRSPAPRRAAVDAAAAS